MAEMLERLVLVVGHEEERRAQLGVDPQQLLPHLVADVAVERGHRLVEEQHPRAADQRPGDGDALLLPAGQLAGLALLEAGEADELEHLPHAAVDLGLRGSVAAVGRQPEGDVVEHGQVREEGVPLEDHVEGAPLGRPRR